MMQYEIVSGSGEVVNRVAIASNLDLIAPDTEGVPWRPEAGFIARKMAQPLAPEAPPLASVKARLVSRVEMDAEGVRLRYITPGSGMAMTYGEKRDQAAAVHAIGETAANALTADQAREAYPTLAASIGIEGATLWACAQLVIARAEAWADLSYAIERARIVGKKAISDASDAAAAQAAYEAITWPT